MGEKNRIENVGEEEFRSLWKMLKGPVPPNTAPVARRVVSPATTAL